MIGQRLLLNRRSRLDKKHLSSRDRVVRARFSTTNSTHQCDQAAKQLSTLSYLTLHNQITDIKPLSSLTNLAYLFLTNNQIADQRCQLSFFSLVHALVHVTGSSGQRLLLLAATVYSANKRLSRAVNLPMYLPHNNRPVPNHKNLTNHSKNLTEVKH